LSQQQSPANKQLGKPQGGPQGKQQPQQPQQQPGNKPGGKPQGPGQPQTPQPTQPQPVQVEAPKERKLKAPQDVLDKRAGNMLAEYTDHEEISDAVEYIEEIVKEVGDISFVFAAVLLKAYQYRKPKEQELCAKLITYILTEKKTLVNDDDLLFAFCIIAPATDELSEDFPKIVSVFASSLAELIKLGRLSVDKLSVILKDSVDSTFALKSILETANIILQHENGSATVEKIEFGSFFTNRKNFESLASKYPSLKDILAKF